MEKENKQPKVSQDCFSREIKFRAWDKKKKIVIPVNEIYAGILEEGYKIGKKETVVHLYDKKKKPYCQEKKYITLMQYAGLKDKNGIEIYEFDIVRWSDGNYKHESNPRVAVVEFSPDLSFYAVNCTDYYNTGKYGCRVGYGHKFSGSNLKYIGKSRTSRNNTTLGVIFTFFFPMHFTLDGLLYHTQKTSTVEKLLEEYTNLKKTFDKLPLSAGGRDVVKSIDKIKSEILKISVRSYKEFVIKG